MKFTNYNNWLNENYDESITVLLPGSFKILHAGHITLMRRYANYPNVKEVIVLIGAGIRNGITQKTAKEVAELLLKYDEKIKVKLSKYPSPILTAYKYIETAEPGTYALGAAEKDEGPRGYQKVLDFVKGYNEGGKYFHLKPEGVNVVELKIDSSPLLYKGRTDEYNGKPISGSILRQDILNDDYNNFRTNYPGYDEDIIQHIWGMTQLIIKESLNEKFIDDSDPIKDLGIGGNGKLLTCPHCEKTFFQKWDETIKSLVYPIKYKRRIEHLIHCPNCGGGWITDQKIIKNKLTHERYIDDKLHINRRFLFEGGNIFDGTGPIPKENIEPTLNKFKERLNKLFPKVKFDFELLGSAGKKPVSGDIDLALSEMTIFDKNLNIKYDDWNIDPKQYEETYERIRKRVKSSTEKQSKLRAAILMIDEQISQDTEIISDSKGSGSGTLFCSFPQYDKNGIKQKLRVQIDINIGDIKWLKFSYHSETYESNVKGLHRTQLIVALFKNKDRTFRHGSGVVNLNTGEYEASTPEEAIELLNKLYGFKLNENIVGNFFKLHKFLIDNISKEELYKVYDIYLKILDSTRTDIPEEMQAYWIANQDRLELKGAFLPEDSKLYKFKK